MNAPGIISLSSTCNEDNLKKLVDGLTGGMNLAMEFKSKKFKPRDKVKDGENLCQYCTGKCCRYYAFPISKPKTWEDFDFIRWYLLHGKAAIFVDEGTWYIMVYADCEHLLEDSRCGIYETRPQICREYTTDDCEYDTDSGYDKLFERPEQIEEYAEAILPPRKRAPWWKERQKSLALPVVT